MAVGVAESSSEHSSAVQRQLGSSMAWPQPRCAEGTVKLSAGPDRIAPCQLPLRSSCGPTEPEMVETMRNFVLSLAN